jgi:AcrR family transcriptional regulator
MLRPNVDQRKSEILEAAVQVIIDVGFTEMTVADVAKVAGVSTALVHHHFSSKVDLITAAVRVACEDDEELRNSVAEGAGSVVHRLGRVLCGSLPSDPGDASWLLWAAARLSALRDGLAIQQTLFGGGQSPEVFVDEFRGGICNELGLSRAEYDRLVAISE